MDAEMTYCFSAMRNKHSLLCDLSWSTCQKLRSNKAWLAKSDWFKKDTHLKCCISLLKVNLLFVYDRYPPPKKNLMAVPHIMHIYLMIDIPPKNKTLLLSPT